jgi:uncharacterized protein (TIGR03437 family)
MSVRVLSILVLLPLAVSAQAPREVAPQRSQLNAPLGVTPETSAPATLVYQNTANPTGSGFAFNGHATLGSNLAANVDMNMLTLAAGSAGQSISALSVLAYNFNSVAVEGRPTMYIWAADDGGNPTSLLGSFVLPITSFAAGSQQTLSLTLPGSGIIVPANGEIWAGIGFDNDNGASTIAGTQLDNLGALTYHPATVGTDGPNAYFMGPGTSLNDPAVNPFGSAFTANYGWTVQATATLALPAPSITSGGVVPLNSTVATIQPSEWVSIYGTNLASSTVTWNGNFPTSLGGTSVTIGGKAAYLWYVSPTQINLQAPDGASAGSVAVAVTTASGTATSTVTLAPVAPSFLLLDSKHVTGIILTADGSGAYGGGTYDIIGPTGNSLGYATVAAKAGDNIELFAVGLGPTDPAVPAGQAFSSAAPTTDPVGLIIDNISVTPAFAGLSGAGLYQINLTVPAGLGTGDVPLVATAGGAQSPSGVVISLQ